MKNLRETSKARNRELGSVAILIAFMWTTLFGMAVVAVDFGYLYTKRRNIQAAADAAITAGMPLLAKHNQTGAVTRATAVANANGFSGPDIQAGPTATATQLTVTLQHTYPTFFGSVLGMTPKTIKATSIGQVDVSAGAAIHANISDCAAAQWAQEGIEVTGAGLLLVNGDVESNSKIHVGNLSIACDPATTCRVTGNVSTACVAAEVWNDDPTHFGMPAVSPAATLPDPLAGNTLATLGAFCTVGTVGSSAVGGPNWDVNFAPGCDRITPGVYCTSGGFNVAPPLNPTICPSNASFIAGGAITITGNGAITITAAGGVPGRIIAYSDYAGGGPAIQLSNGPLIGQYTLNGSIYAPNGLINAGTGTPGFTMNGIMDGNIVVISTGPGQPWTFNGPGAGGGTWHLYK
jgi:hypothetical protein